MERRTIRTNQCWLINGITFFGEFFWLFKRAVSGKVMDVLGGSKQDNAPIGKFDQGDRDQKSTLGFHPCCQVGQRKCEIIRLVQDLSIVSFFWIVK
jgi:hypothetical protein